MRYAEKILVLAGPTGSGKTALARQLPDRYEIINADTRQFYSGVSIAACGPEAADYAGHVHHLFGFLDPARPMDARRYAEMAAQAIREIISRGGIPAVVGGSGFYLRALLEGMLDTEPIPTAFWPKADSILATGDAGRVLRANAAIAQLDPRRFEHIHPNDKYRLRFALAYCLAVAEGAISPEKIRHSFLDRSKYDCLEIWIQWDRPSLHRRIETRAGALIEAGIIEEYRRLRRAGYGLRDPGLLSLGYRFIEEHTQGHFGLDRLRELLVIAHRQYAKKQETWFRNISPFRAMPGDDPHQLLATIQNWENK